jgi:hypothetical protein
MDEAVDVSLFGNQLCVAQLKLLRLVNWNFNMLTHGACGGLRL